MLTRCWGGFFLWQRTAEISSESPVFFFGVMMQGTRLRCYHPYPCSSGVTTWEGQLAGHLFCPLSFDVETDKSVLVDPM
jgi:hypothetical protein